MINWLPAILIGGPPHAGKSVLFYQITRALQDRRIPHYAIRACPDGEGNWFYEGNPEVVETIRVKLTEWPAEFVQRISQDLKHRCLPFLVDVGGRPKASEKSLFRLCSHSILLLRPDIPQDTQLWQNLVDESNLLPLAQLFSQQEGDSVITAREPVLEGTIVGLERHVAKAGHSPLFDELIERIVKLFNSYNLQNVKETHLEQAPTELVLDLDDGALQPFATASGRWEPEMLQPFLTSLPAQTPISVYGRIPCWLYAALAAYENDQSFYLFDTKIGWLQPARVYLGTTQSSEIRVELQCHQDFTVLKITLLKDRIQYFQPDLLAFPSVPAEQGIVINGRAPNWLLTALARLYKEAGAAWIAPFYPPLNKAIVVYSRVETYQLGDLVSVPN